MLDWDLEKKSEGLPRPTRKGSAPADMQDAPLD